MAPVLSTLYRPTDAPAGTGNVDEVQHAENSVKDTVQHYWLSCRELHERTDTTLVPVR